ncbi:MAG: SDR family oxidoreductase [Verrucomicrobiales bacterium]
MRIVVIGSAGRVGAALARHFRQQGHAVIAFDRKALDLTRAEIVQDRLGPLAFDACINAAALTNVDYCEAHPAEACAANAEGPARLAEICASRRRRFVHLSTDYVYDGTQPGLRAETDDTQPVNVYAQSKLDGEQRVLEKSAGSALVVRTSWIFGPDRAAFPDSIIERAKKSDYVEAIADKRSVPTYSLDFAAHLEPLVTGPDPGLICGLLNLCNHNPATWHTYAQTALDLAAELGVPLRCRRVTPTSLASVSFGARRPVHTAMSTEKFTALTGQRPRPWQDALAEYLKTYY